MAALGRLVMAFKRQLVAPLLRSGSSALGASKPALDLCHTPARLRLVAQLIPPLGWHLSIHAQGLIANIPRTRRWRVTVYGRRVMGTWLYRRHHHFQTCTPERSIICFVGRKESHDTTNLSVVRRPRTRAHAEYASAFRQPRPAGVPLLSAGIPYGTPDGRKPPFLPPPISAP